jgi:hypothetical protein
MKNVLCAIFSTLVNLSGFAVLFSSHVVAATLTMRFA